MYVFRRRLQDVLVKINIFVLNKFLQDVFKTSSQCLAKTSSRRLPKLSSRHVSLRRLKDYFQRYIQDVSKTCCQVKLFLLTRLQEVLQGLLSREGFSSFTILRKLWSVSKICKREKNFQVLVFYFTTPLHTTPFSGVLTEAYLESGWTSTIEVFLRKYWRVLWQWVFSQKKLLAWVENRLLAKTFKILTTILLPVYKLSQGNTQPGNMCDIVFEKLQCRVGKLNRNYFPVKNYYRVKNCFTGAFKAICTRWRSSHSKAFISLKIQKTVCEGANLLWSCQMPKCKLTKKFFLTFFFMHFSLIFSEYVTIASSEDALIVWEYNFFLGV